MFDQDAMLWDEWADTYNEKSLGPAAPVAAVLAELAAGGPALELGIGMGRVALPLARHGVPVTGLDVSTKMVRHLAERTGDLPVDYRLADMASFTLPGRHTLVYVVASTFYLLASAERQQGCLNCCGRALMAGGRLVVEASVPGSAALPLESGVIPRAVDEGVAKLSIVLHEAQTQLLHSQEVRLSADGTSLRKVTRRYVHLDELDQMAAFAGFTLEARYNGWDRTPYEDGQERHISVYSVPGQLGGGLGEG
ncbi:class I SAM-dependent methyltransferase [Streptomyces sp. NBC_01465]|uniref:class I SAM-dependent methyltransferase n=1 Tax=Streptomyces sp. NBC_01465 TaxID=2903878 RepID=UPI002E330BFE|nr:class I SAM-dependent methyltransferase [Streptomyces sp. NBC_01465]